MDKQPVLCDLCEEVIEENTGQYFIYCILVDTKDKTYYIGILKLLEELGNWQVLKGYHLSASEILLLRPDIMMEFFGQRYKEDIVENFRFDLQRICKECYEEYTLLVPLI